LELGHNDSQSMKNPVVLNKTRSRILSTIITSCRRIKIKIMVTILKLKSLSLLCV